MPYQKPTTRQCIEAYKDGCYNFHAGLKYNNEYHIDSKLWRCRERGFARELKRESKRIPLMQIMETAKKIAVNRKRQVCFYVGKIRLKAA